MFRKLHMKALRAPSLTSPFGRSKVLAAMGQCCPYAPSDSTINDNKSSEISLTPRILLKIDEYSSSGQLPVNG